MKVGFRAEPITERLYRVEMPGNVFGYLIKGDKRGAVIDTGFGLGSLRSFVEPMLDGLPYDVILTHGHFDHAGGAAEFERVWLDERDLPLAAEHTQPGLRLGALLRDYPDIEETDLIGAKSEGYLPLRPGQAFDLGGETLRIVDLSGHTLGNVGILFEKERILLAGDACCSFTLFFGGGGSRTIGEYRDTLMRLWEMYGDRFDTVLYSHPHNYGGPEVISQMIRLCDEILAGTDDHIPMMGRFGGETYIAKKTGPDGRRPDGEIANLQYTKDNL